MLYEYTIIENICLLLMDIYVISNVLLLWRMLQWVTLYMPFHICANMPVGYFPRSAIVRAKGMPTTVLIDLVHFFGTEMYHFAVPLAMLKSAPLLTSLPVLYCHGLGFWANLIGEKSFLRVGVFCCCCYFLVNAHLRIFPPSPAPPNDF